MHCRVWRCTLNIYTLTNGLAIDGCEVFFCFCIVESPDAFNARLATIVKVRVVNNPDSNNVSLEIFKIIRVILGWTMREINNHNLFDFQEE